ncbi:cyd operon protein YbgT [Aureimonas altamirensis DSM 21988]|jgi:cytochrome bd-I ubiquinol oxidase subunit X|uniref:Cyd operon protein YbgT n=1 Tax=Aureimonas altamirensis DSM 21988 TaxID=1121026 RepID=A0ABY1IP89_9HYPH|nr:cytochrome bd-I oxidase subunit CydX [Aureimonas altamirensis]UHD45665.1 cytochrome bd-I oxidase subunit CydX [Aureimonas altamirensis]SHJ74894.1 cyd operon protein YbgT [Aureimonas altamirensis DSM 21988]
MWYFSWILGVGLACAFAILNAMWFEMREDRLLALPADGPAQGTPAARRNG